MSHFAKIENGIVTQVIVAEQDVINSGLFGAPHTWVQTSYNTHNGVHALGGTPLRKNFAGIGYTYDSIADEFNPPVVTTPSSQVIQNNDVITLTVPTATVTVTTTTASDTITLSTASETITL